MVDLKRYQDIKREMLKIQNKVYELECLKLAPKSQIMSGMPVYHDVDCDTNCKNIIRLETLKENYDTLFREMLVLENAILTEIYSLPIDAVKMIYYRYVRDLGWREVQRNIGVSRSKMFRLHKEAVSNLS